MTAWGGGTLPLVGLVCDIVRRVGTDLTAGEILQWWPRMHPQLRTLPSEDEVKAAMVVGCEEERLDWWEPSDETGEPTVVAKGFAGGTRGSGHSMEWRDYSQSVRMVKR